MDIYKLLKSNSISFEEYTHLPVFTCQEADKLVPKSDGIRTKNLFLRDKKGKNHFLVVLPAGKILDLDQFSNKIGAVKLGFASHERLQNYLGVTPGSVSILAKFNDVSKEVNLYIDSLILESKKIACHPLINDKTLVIETKDILRLLEKEGHSFKVC